MNTQFWLDSEDSVSDGLCDRIDVEASIYIDDYEILSIVNDDTGKTLTLDELSERDRAHVLRVLKDKVEYFERFGDDRWRL